MKKLLSLLSVLIVGGSTTLSVVACGNSSGAGTNPGHLDVNEHVKNWSNQSSNIAKSVILGKMNHLNTNNILKNGLKHNINNITNASTSDTGKDYSSFTKDWGYNGSIAGITEQDFNSDSSNTIDNNVKTTESGINGVMSQIPLILSVLQQKLKDNSTFSDFILQKNDSKYTFASLLAHTVDLSSLNQYSSYIPYVQTVANLVSQFLETLEGFNPEKVLGAYYPGTNDATPSEIQNSLFKVKLKSSDKAAGWIANYQPIGDDTGYIDSINKKSDILQGENQKLFQTWDQVALFKDGADLNSAIAEVTNDSSGKAFNLSDLFQNAIIFDDNGKVKEFNKDKFAQGLATIYNAITTGKTSQIFGNIVLLAAPIINIVKYKILGFKPTQDFTTITSSEKSDPANGIVSIREIMENVSKILLTKNGFTNFFTNIFFPGKDENADDYFLSLDITCQTNKGNFAVEQVINPIKSQIIDAINFAYDNYIDPLIKKYYIRDIFVKIIADLSSITDNFSIHIGDVIKILKVLETNSLREFLNILFTCKNENDLQKNWVTLWETAGIQKDPKAADFVADSMLADLHGLLYNSGKPVDTTNFTNLTGTINKCIKDGCDTFLNKINQNTSEQLDFDNAKLWAIKDGSINFDYDKQANQSTISYELTYQGRSYNVIVVVNTNAHDAISNNQKVWLKSLTGLK